VGDFAHLHLHTWNRDQFLWLAGWLEGEGSFGLNRGVVPILQSSSLDRDVVRRGVTYTLCGNITVSGRFGKPFYAWTVYGREAYAIMVAIYPLMGERRQKKIKKVIDGWLAIPPRRRRVVA
jgi:hypothetical protein